MKLTELFSDLQQCIELGLIRPKEGANRAIDAICATDKERKFTIDELRELLANYSLLTLGLEQLIAINFNK
jgi:hypothetical protein